MLLYADINRNSINKQKLLLAFLQTQNAIKRGKITKNKIVKINFTKPHPHTNKDHSSSSKLNYYHQL